MEALATHHGPLSCAGDGNVAAEAFTAVPAGQHKPLDALWVALTEKRGSSGFLVGTYNMLWSVEPFYLP